MKMIALFLICFNVAFAQDALESLRWYLNPQNQNIIISIDDLHDEVLQASPEMNWGSEILPQLRPQKDITIAVIDGGVEIDHPELKNFIAFNSAECFNGTIIPDMKEDKDNNGLKGDCAGWNFVDNNNRPEDLDGHGTHVSGVIHAMVKSFPGQIKVLPLKVFAPDEGRRSVKVSTSLSTRLTKAFEYAMARHVDVIHMSVGWPKSFMTYDLEQMIIKAQNSGIIVVSAAGNSSQRASIYPCQMKGVICVGALRPDGNVARFSNWGSQVDIQAAGEKILSTIPHPIAPLYISRRGYDYKNGTSQAAPFISGAMAVLKSIYPDETKDALYARLMMTAKNAKEASALKGLFQLDRALNIAPRSFIFPEVKSLNSVVLDQDSFKFTLPVRNYWLDKNQPTQVLITCPGTQLQHSGFKIATLASGAVANIEVAGILTSGLKELNCMVRVEDQAVPFKLKVLKPLKAAFKEFSLNQTDLLVSATRMGAKSRFMTLDALPGTVPSALYYVSGTKDLTLYKEDKALGSYKLDEKCQLLRVWQVDLNKDQENDLMVEAMCEKAYLRYQFMDLKFKELFPKVTFRPSLTIVNYEAFELILSEKLPPTFRFMNVGLDIPSSDPWDSNITTRKNHLYELRPVKEKDKDTYSYDLAVLEEPKLWMKSLALRVMPEFRVLHFIKDRLLIMAGEKTAWVDIKTQTATWAKLDHLLLLGSKKQTLHGTDSYVIQSFLTPYEYRGFTLDNGVTLRFKQDSYFDPFIDILATRKNDQGYLTILRSYQNLIYVQYDFAGNFLSKKISLVDRFDFLTAQDLISSVINLTYEGRMLQVVDGTKINTDYVDVMLDGEKKSYEIPFHCVTQQPVIVDGKLSLPIFCGKSRTEFEMKFIEL